MLGIKTPLQTSMSSSMSSIVESQVLHTTTTRMLHAHNFARSSTQATHALTGALSRYLTLVAETCAQYAQHAGRTGVTVRDALAALEEVGVSIEELHEYVEGEAQELVRYTGQTARRAEELADLRSRLAEGMTRDFSDAIQLVYAPEPEDLQESPDEDDDDASETQVDSAQVTEDVSQVKGLDAEMAFEMPRTTDPYTDLITPPSSPHLPLSPISPPHVRKRARTSNWKPPDYVPDFLPPFPGSAISPQGSPPHEPALQPIEPTDVSIVEPMPAASSSATVLDSQVNTESQKQIPQPPRPPSPVLPTSTSTSSSYLTSIPYEHSSLASVPEWHLPSAPRETSPPPTSSTIPALLSSHSYLQSSSLSAPSLQPPNPARHGLAMMLLGVSSRAYSPSATLFASNNTNTCAPLPRRAAPLATHAVPLDKHGRASFALGVERGKLPVPPADWHARSVAGPVAIVGSTAVQGSRIPGLARMILPAPIIARATRLIPPPPLERNNQKLLYGPPVPAPWNSASGAADGKGGKNGKEKGEEDEEEDRVLSDAHLFATWDYDSRDFRGGLPVARRGSKVGFVSGNGAVPLKRKRSDSAVPARRASEVGSALARIKMER